jgi:hypothetical protein
MTDHDHEMVSRRSARSAFRTFFSLHLNGALRPAPQLPLLNNSLREYDEDGKLQIILTIYTQMVTYIQEIRARVERIVIVGSGLIILLDGWFVAASHSPTVSGKFVASVGVGLFTSARPRRRAGGPARSGSPPRPAAPQRSRPAAPRPRTRVRAA